MYTMWLDTPEWDEYMGIIEELGEALLKYRLTGSISSMQALRRAIRKEYRLNHTIWKQLIELEREARPSPLPPHIHDMTDEEIDAQIRIEMLESTETESENDEEDEW